MKEPSTAVAIVKPLKPPANLKLLSNELAQAKTPEAVLDFERRIAAYEAYMRRAGFSQGDLHEINEHRMRARWRLGQMLAAVERGKAGRKGNKERAAPHFNDVLKRIGLEKARAIEAQRIGWLPKIELEKIFQRARAMGELVTIQWLVDEARPYWYKESRKERHTTIAEAAAAQDHSQPVRTYPLIYADPPWTFNIYSEKGLERTPTQHYPTMTDQEIVACMSPFVPKTGAMLMWCTSSNQPRAEAVLAALGYEFKSSAVWVKLGGDGHPISGLGLIFRNMHEVIIYATRGNMPGPQYQPPSVFLYPRQRHSAKPPEIRDQIERMYPNFDEQSRIEVFSRDNVPGWTHFGFEAGAMSIAAE